MEIKVTSERYRVFSFALGPIGTNCYLVVHNHTKNAVLIDPAAQGEELLKLLQENGFTLQQIINTHGHFDHIGANALLQRATGAALAIHSADADKLSAAGIAALAARGIQIDSSIPDRLLQDGDELVVDDLVFHVLHTPGHSAGGICLLLDNLLFCGDTLFAGSIGRTDFEDGNFNTLIAAIEKQILPLADEVLVLPGHGECSTVGEERRVNPYLR